MTRLCPVSAVRAALGLLALAAGIGLGQDTIWTRRLGRGERDYGACGGVDPLGGVVIVGHARDPDSGTLVIEAAKYAATGESLWSRTYQSSGNNYNGDATTDVLGNVLVVGQHDTAATVIKYDRNGELVWVRELLATPNGEAWFGGVVTDESADIYAAGWSCPGTTGEDLLLAKYSSDGDLVWTRTVDMGGNTEYIAGLAIAPDGALVGVGGTGEDSRWSFDIAVVKFAPDGETTWTRRLDLKYEDWGAGIAVDADGSFYVTGYAGHWPEVPDSCVAVKYTPGGDTMWARLFGGSQLAAGDDIAVTPDGNVLVCATVTDTLAGRCAVVLVCYSPRGDTVWTHRHRPDSSNSGGALQFEGPEALYLFGICSDDPSGQASDLLLMKFRYDVAVAEPHPPAVRWSSGASIVRRVVYMVPSASGLGRVAALLDAEGRRAMDLKPGLNRVSGLPPGVYFVVSKDAGEVTGRKVVLAK